MTDLTLPIYTDESKAREHLEVLRWPNGPICPHCGVVGNAALLEGKSTRPGVWKCRECRKPFSVTVGTLFERSHIPLNKWLLAVHLLSSSKKGMSAHQLHRMMGVTYKSAWFMAHRIREAMTEYDPEPLGGKDKVVEADETFIGKPNQVFVNGRGWVTTDAWHTKRKVISLVERGGRARSFHVVDLKPATIRKVLFENVVLDSRLHTDEAGHYKHPGREFAKHERVNHGNEEYARGDVTTNTVEGFFSIFKRGMTGVYHHCGEQHLKRYLAEFDFRYSNRAALGVDDTTRAERALKAIKGKRLTYRRTAGKRQTV
ncbi:MAG TPA: IS1595 family transposase [Stellaceae bacterium]|nr:IS1595 family transposase [Stellaceae bacterium]